VLPTRVAVQEEIDGIRARGGGGGGAPLLAERPQLLLTVDGSNVEAGAFVSNGARVKFSVNSGTYDHVLVFGVEVDGTLTPYYPQGPGQSLLVGRGRGLPLPDGIVLDGLAGKERFVAVFSSRPLTFDEVKKARQAGQTLTGTEEAIVWLVERPQ